MSQRVFQVPSFSATVLAEAATLTDGNYLGIGNQATATNRIEVTEIYMGGQAATATVAVMMFARHSTIAVTYTALSAPNSDGPMDGLTQVITAPSRGFVGATTDPIRSTATTSARLALTYNAFGGIVRWTQNKGYGWFITGVTVDVSESSLSNFTGGATASMGAHIIYEQV